jgi:putative transposase
MKIARIICWQLDSTLRPTSEQRMVFFCDVKTKTEFRLVTNLPDDGDAAVSDEEIKDIYRLRWGV